MSEFEKKIGYLGCRNCKHQIAPLRACKWMERGGDGDGVVHLICPHWERKALKVDADDLCKRGERREKE